MADKAEIVVELEKQAQASSVDSESKNKSELVPALNSVTGKGMIWKGWPPSAHQAPRPSPVAELRDKMRKGLEKELPGLLEDIAKGKISKVQGLDFLAKYGIGATGTVTIVSPDVIARLERQAAAIAARPQWDTVELLALLRDIWT